jgi:hypothetical protein
MEPEKSRQVTSATVTQLRHEEGICHGSRRWETALPVVGHQGVADGVLTGGNKQIVFVLIP